MTRSRLKSKVNAIVEHLPPDGQEELADYLDFLANKYQLETPKNFITLGGIWKATPLDVTDDDVRALRRETSKRIVEKLDNGFSS